MKIDNIKIQNISKIKKQKKEKENSEEYIIGETNPSDDFLIEEKEEKEEKKDNLIDTFI
jgi:hypothetical protein